MKILFLGREDSPIRSFLTQEEECVVWTDQPFKEDFILSGHFDFLVSYNYQYILKSHILAHFPNTAVNLHISFLPWNRGRDPNLWSFIEHSPKGVTIHYLDAGVDTGDILVQKEIFFREGETLASTYEILQLEIQKLFIQHWPDIRSGICPRTKQPEGGSVHRAIDKNSLLYLLTDGWQTPVSKLNKYKS